MKLLFKMLVVALLLNGLTRAAMAEYRFYVFEDAVQQEALFSQKMSPEQLVDRVAQIAEQQQVPVDAGDITVNYTGPQATVALDYSERVQLVPRVYARDWPFEMRVSVRRIP